jgi:hypothetical protein
MPAESVQWWEFTPLDQHSQLGFSGATALETARSFSMCCPRILPVLGISYVKAAPHSCCIRITPERHAKFGFYLLFPGHPLLTEVNVLFSDARLHEYFSPRESNAL